MNKRVAIVGAGTAGMASSIFLQRLGYDVTVFEKIETPSPVGAGILLQPTGLSVLNELGLHADILKQGSVVEALDGRTQKGRPVIDLKYGDLYPGCFGLGVHRASLFELLRRQLLVEGVNLVTGVSVDAYEQDAEAVHITIDGKRQAMPYDLLLVCNGARSELRSCFDHVSMDKPYPWGALWTIVEKPEGLSDRCLKQVYRTASYMAGLLPSGRLHGDGPELLSFFWSIPTEHYSQWQSGDVNFSEWKIKALNLWPELEPVLDQLTNPKQLAFANYRDVVMKRWAEGRVAFLGDAAHSMSPQLGQGANLALCDSAAIYHCLRNNPDINSALDNYNDVRRGHVRFYQDMSRLLTPFYQSHKRSYALLRDLLSWPLTQIPWLRHQMLATLVGVKNGWLGEMPVQPLSDQNASESIFSGAVSSD